MVGPEISRRLPYYEGLRVNLCQFLGAGSLLAASLLHNMFAKRPLNAGLPKHLAYLVGGFFLGSQCSKYLKASKDYKRSVIEDYICKHPEDFPLVKPKKYRDTLLPWNPIR